MHFEKENVQFKCKYFVPITNLLVYLTYNYLRFLILSNTVLKELQVIIKTSKSASKTEL